MASRGALVAASILDADFGNLYRVVRKLEKARVDRLHLDVMDGHFVPNLTFGPDVVRAFRRLTGLPLDLHLMIAEPSRYVPSFIRALAERDRRGADSITFHVEVAEGDSAKRETLESIRAARHRPGLAISPRTDVTALEPFLPLLDVILVMTVEPGFGGQKFMEECAAKIAPASALLRARDGAEVHVDGGVSSETAPIAGRYGVDVLVVGSALFQRGRDTAREVALVRTRADEARGSGRDREGFAVDGSPETDERRAGRGWSAAGRRPEENRIGARAGEAGER